jgi:hypothetical protein
MQMLSHPNSYTFRYSHPNPDSNSDANPHKPDSSANNPTANQSFANHTEYPELVRPTSAINSDPSGA